MADYYSMTKEQRYQQYQQAVDNEIANAKRNNVRASTDDNRRYSNFNNTIQNTFNADRRNRANKTKSITDSVNEQHNKTMKDIQSYSGKYSNYTLDDLKRDCDNITNSLAKVEHMNDLKNSIDNLSNDSDTFKDNSKPTQGLKDFNNRFDEYGNERWH